MLVISILLALSASCPDAKVDSLFLEIGDGSTITPEKAKAIRSEAYRAIDGSDPECEASMKLEDLAFDMSTILAMKFEDYDSTYISNYGD